MKENSGIFVNHRASRRSFLAATGILGAAAVIGTGCETEESTGKPVDKMSPPEELAPFHSLNLLTKSNALKEIGTGLIKTSGMLSLIDQDITYYNFFGGKTFKGDKNATKQVEDLTYLIKSEGASLYGTRKKTYKSLTNASLNEHVTQMSNPAQLWIVTGQLHMGKVETGDDGDDKVEAVYLRVQGIYKS